MLPERIMALLRPPPLPSVSNQVLTANLPPRMPSATGAWNTELRHPPLLVYTKLQPKARAKRKGVLSILARRNSADTTVAVTVQGGYDLL